MNSMINLKVRDLMSENVVTINTETPFTEACRMFIAIHVHHLPVLSEEGYLVGLFSTTDALYALNNLVYQKIDSEEDVNRLIPIDSVMTSDKIYTLKSDSDLQEAIKLFQDEKINSIPIVDEGVLVGILTSNDLLGEINRLTLSAKTDVLS